MTTTVRGGTVVEDSRLGRVAPKTWTHVDNYPLTAYHVRALSVPQPVGIGINWYRNFYADRLLWRKDGWWVREGELGDLMGGHAITLEPFTGPHRDRDFWWEWHNQVNEGICVSEMSARLMALLNRRMYQPRPIYDIAQTIDEWAGEDYEGTSVNAGLATLRGYGAIRRKAREQHYLRKGSVTRPFRLEEGITENRWAVNDDDFMAVLGNRNSEYAVWLNSWGNKDYPHRVKVPRSVLSRLRREDGEFGIVTDRPT